MRTLFGAANGTAYRFKVPLVGAPPPGGDRVQVVVAYVADSHAHLLATNEPLCQHLAQARVVLDKINVVQLVVNDVLWLLPMTQENSKTEVTYGSIKADRWLLKHCEETASRVAPAMPVAQVEKSFFCHLDWEEHRPRWDRPWAAPYSYRSRIPPPEGYGPLSCRTSQDPNMVAQVPDTYANREEESDEEDWDDMSIEEELPVNVALKRPINFIRYVDVLPRGNQLPMDAKLIDRRFTRNDVWAVEQDLQTFFLATKTEPGVRRRAWHQLTTPSLGVTGNVLPGGSSFTFSAGGLRSGATFKHNSFKPGPTVLKLVPVGDDYACQPTSATAAASYILNNWRLVVEQDGKQVDMYDLLAKNVFVEDLQSLQQLAELASAEGAAGRIIYAQRAYWYGEKTSGVGVRLRDGGSRFRLTKIDDEVAEFKLPADRYLHSKWGRFDGKDIGPELYPKTPVMAHLRVPTGSQEQDVIFRTNESDVGDFHQLEYALRPRGSCKAIKSDEWKPVDCSILDEWIICFFCNIARVTWAASTATSFARPRHRLRTRRYSLCKVRQPTRTAAMRRRAPRRLGTRRSLALCEQKAALESTLPLRAIYESLCLQAAARRRTPLPRVILSSALGQATSSSPRNSSLSSL